MTNNFNKTTGERALNPRSNQRAAQGQREEKSHCSQSDGHLFCCVRAIGNADLEHHPSYPIVIPLLPAAAPTELLLPGWSQKQHTPASLEKEGIRILCLVLGTLGNAHMRHREAGMVTCHIRSCSESTLGFRVCPLQSTPFKSDGLLRDAVCCGGECTLMLGVGT